MSRDPLRHLISTRLPGATTFAAAAMLLSLPAPASAQAGPTVIPEALEATSTFTRQDCLGPCACISPPYAGPLTGSFTLHFNHADTWTRYYDITDGNLTAHPIGPGGVWDVTYTGTGTYEIGGDFAYTHHMHLDLLSNRSGEGVQHFDSGTVLVPSHHPFPRASIQLTTGVLGCTQRSMLVEVTPNTCRGDFNGDGAATVQDIFDYLAAWFVQNPLADFNGDGAVTIQDLFSFLAAWFAGC